MPASWMRYVWIALAVVLGLVAVGFGVLSILLADICETDCGGTAGSWVLIALGTAAIVAAIVDAVRTFKRNRRDAP